MSKEKVMLSELEAGAVFSSKSGRKYKILKQEDGQAKVITLDLMAEKKIFDEDETDYKTSRIKGFIEGELQPLIEDDFGADNLVEHEADLTTVDMQKNYGTCHCEVRLISFDEAREHNADIVNLELKDWYWTLTPWNTVDRGWAYSLAVVSPQGHIFRNFCDYINGGLRPVCILKSNILVSKED